MFKQVPTHVKFPELEEEILRFWQSRRIYEQSLAQRAGAPRFVFYEGPPTANGLPHPGHCLTRAIKDLFPRYRTMRGYLCERKAGWDTHGLPVEVEVCKELGIHSKEEIEQYGVEPFIHRCQESVWRYMRQWEQLTERLGFWIHLDDAYVTYHQSYVESVWWSLQRLFERGLLYQGHKIVWWWAQGGTALSSGEVGQGYREVADPSVYVCFPLLDEPDTSLLVWTTTPWTLPNNQFVAVHPDLDYVTVCDEQSGQRLIMAAALRETIAEKAKRQFRVEATWRGQDLVGRRYRPPFDYYYARDGQHAGRLRAGGSEPIAWRVVAADFVTVDSGTGVVHQAPAFGEVDYEVLLAEQARFVDGQGPPLICGVGPDGRFTDEVPDYAGRWVKEADGDLILHLRRAGCLLMREQYLHEYPFCWRSEEDPLIQYPRKSWFIRTTAIKQRMLENNRQINWLPDHIRDGRFGNFLETNVDWALSRERYWGTPLPIWVCDRSGRAEAVASYQELQAKPGASGFEVWEQAKRRRPELPDDLRVHKPYVDAITYDSPFVVGGRMRRVPEVIDCWYDSGAMPFAQWGYPHQQRERFAAQFPADFISEALDQTRGWFYSLLAISTLLFGDEESSAAVAPSHAFPHPYRTCIVLGLMLAEWWESTDGKERFLSEGEARSQCGTKYTQRIGKMSKSLRNYRSPQEIFDVHGADALRWYFFANQAPWNSIIYSERAIKESIPEFQLRLWNVYSFFVIYANIDGFDPSQAVEDQVGELDPARLTRVASYRPVADRAEIDRWVLSELHAMVGTVVERMDQYDSYGACARINEYVDALSNWYVRRNRDRFWSGAGQSADKLDAHWTLYECLLTVSKVIAPFVPFLAESIWQNLAGVFGSRVVESVHLCRYPTCDAALVDQTLSQRMELLREIASLGRAARMQAKLKVRQPLSRVEVVLADATHQPWLEEHHALVREELNVKEVACTTEGDEYITYLVQPNFKRLGPRVGRLMPALKQALTTASGAVLLAQLRRHGRVEIPVDRETVTLDADDIEVRLQAKEGWTAAQGSHVVVVLATELTPALVREGFAQDLKRQIQDRRKSLGCQYTDRIRVGVVTDSDDLWTAIEENRAYLLQETLATHLVRDALPGVTPLACELAEAPVQLYVEIDGEPRRS
ncbi:MAG: isoleucine--tRNA ligase [Pirellulaceae bacterium]|jgi:isoleucyl-tRNA synthetase|nr:isoleucine--tRNA ligase [Pirellulaceae bacterium]